MVLAQIADTYGMTAGRTWSLVGGVLGLAGVVLALAARRFALVAVGAGVAGAVAGVLVVAFAQGGPGTGNGIVGGYVSLVVGLAAVLVGLLRRRGVRAAGPSAG
jgi:peptidoglycan/LPS O-acetylase OafA/YrhL